MKIKPLSINTGFSLEKALDETKVEALRIKKDWGVRNAIMLIEEADGSVVTITMKRMRAEKISWLLEFAKMNLWYVLAQDNPEETPEN